MSKIELREINKYYSRGHVLRDINLVIEDGELMTPLGPSGCRKATTLRVVADLEKPQERYMYMGNGEIVSVPEEFYEEPGKRHLNLVFRSYALWPHMTVFDNVAFGLEVTRVPKEGIRKKAENALKRIGIEALIDRYPSELSGGQQQRMAVARAIVSEPEVLLLDEPLSNSDARLRVEIRGEIKRLHQELDTTIIYMTHDQTEALTMSTKVAIFFKGVLEQVAPPMELYQNPASLRVADFTGNPKMNFLPGKARVAGGTITVESALRTVSYDRKSFTGEAPDGGGFEAVVGVRPGLVKILDGPAEGSIEAEIYSVMPADSETTIYLEVGEEQILSKQDGLKQYSPGQKVRLWINPDKMNVFCRDSGRLTKLAIMDAQ